MRSVHLTPWHPLVGLATILAVLALLPPMVRAEDAGPENKTWAPSGKAAQRSPTPDIGVEIRPLLDARDEAAALEAVTVALTEVGDGSTYVWYRHGGRLSGLVQPTQTFRDVLGRVCRHIVVTLNDASRSKRTEGIACRLQDGGWELDG
ncbi:MAG: hypothetical protein AB7L90_20540 [Hyphomicrobiaceae bacterium]